MCREAWEFESPLPHQAVRTIVAIAEAMGLILSGAANGLNLTFNAYRTGMRHSVVFYAPPPTGWPLPFSSGGKDRLIENRN